MDKIAAILMKIYDFIVAQVKERDAISDGSTRIPYQEMTYTIPAGNRQEVFQVFNYFRVISQTASSTLAIRLGQNGIETPFTGQGIGIQCEDVFSRITLINNGASALTITLGLAYGSISDDRLNVSGTVSTSPVAPATFSTSADVSVSATATTQVLAANTSRKEAFISNRAANGTVVRVGDSGSGAADGIELASGGTLILSTTAAIYVFNPTGAAITIGVGETA